MSLFGHRPFLIIRIHFLADALAKASLPEEALTTLDEGLALVEETDEHLWEAELYRLRGELLLMQGDEAEAAASLNKTLRGSSPAERQVVGAAGCNRSGAVVGVAREGGRGARAAGTGLRMVYGRV